MLGVFQSRHAQQEGGVRRRKEVGLKTSRSWVGSSTDWEGSVPTNKLLRFGIRVVPPHSQEKATTPLYYAALYVPPHTPSPFECYS